MCRCTSPVLSIDEYNRISRKLEKVAAIVSKASEGQCGDTANTLNELEIAIENAQRELEKVREAGRVQK